MRVLIISGDKSFKAGHPRFDLQARAVERLEALYWGPGALWAAPQGDSFDVVSTQDPFFRGLIGLFLAWRFGARFNVQVHADLEAQSFLKRLIARFVLRRADSIRVVSERLKQHVLNYGCQTSVITVLPVFVDVSRFRALDRNPDSEPIVLWVGRFEDEKDPLLALSVFKEVCEKVPEAKLIMLGAGSLEGALRRAAGVLNHPNGAAVEFPGWQDPAPYYARARLLLVTSRAESWGASIVEVLASGVPVVSPDVGIAREAGAIVVPKEALASSAISVLKTRPPAVLKLALPDETEWVKMWEESL